MEAASALLPASLQAALLRQAPETSSWPEQVSLEGVPMRWDYPQALPGNRRTLEIGDGLHGEVARYHTIVGNITKVPLVLKMQLLFHINTKSKCVLSDEGEITSQHFLLCKNGFVERGNI